LPSQAAEAKPGISVGVMVVEGPGGPGDEGGGRTADRVEKIYVVATGFQTVLRIRC